MATPNYDINYNDKRFTEVEADKKADLNEVDVTYGNMISQSDKKYQDQIDAAQKYADTQKENQQKQTDFAIEQIEQQKDQAHKDYLKEQSGAYVDWQKQSDQYGVNAEKAAAAGLDNSGYSENANIAMYVAYQNRVAAAREAYGRAVLNYDNAIKDARLQNSSLLAEIAYNALQKQLELSLQGFQYKNQLILDKADKQFEIKKYYSDEYQRVLDQINHENALAEEVRQYNEKMAFDKEKFSFEKDMANKEYQLARDAHNLDVQKYNAQYAGGGSSGGGGTIKKQSNTSSGNKAHEFTKKLVKGAKETAKAVVSNKSSKKESTPKYDMASLTKLGYAGKSAAEINRLVQEGYIDEYEENGVIKFKRSTKALKKSVSSAFNKLFK